MENDSNAGMSVRRSSVDSGAPPSNLDDNQREETELKRPLNRVWKLQNQQYNNFTRHRGKSGQTSDASSITSHCPQTSDTERENHVMKQVENILGKRPSKKGKHSESPYNVHIGKIVINNNPKPDGPYPYYDHPPPPPCANNYNYIKDDARSVYNNVDREAMEQGSTPRASSPVTEEEELHAMISPYRQTKDFVTGGRPTINTKRELDGSLHLENAKEYGFFVHNPEIDIENTNTSLGELEITLRTKGTKPVVWKGKLTPHSSQQDIVTGNGIKQDSTTSLPSDSPKETEGIHVHENVQTDEAIMQAQDARVSTVVPTNPNNVLIQGNAVPSTLTVSAPDLAGASASKVPDLPRQYLMLQNQSNQSSSAPAIDANVPYNHVYRTGNEYMVDQSQRTRPKSNSFFTLSKAKGKQEHNCIVADERPINRIREDLLDYGKEAMWLVAVLEDHPSHPYSLLVKINGQVLTYPVSQDKKSKLSIDNKQKKTFACLCSLISHYKSKTLPMARSNLGPQFFNRPPSTSVYINPTYHDTDECSNTRL